MPVLTPQTALPRRRRLLALTALLGVLASLVVGPAAIAVTETEDQHDRDPASLVVIGVTGLTWDDVDPDTTPALWSLGETGAVGNLVVRSLRPSTCAADGWLALSSGARAGDLPWEDRVTDTSRLTCRPLQEYAPQDSATPGVPGWTDYLDMADESSYATFLGLWGAELDAAGVSSTAIGPGAAIALALPDGSVADLALPRPDEPADLALTVEQTVTTTEVVVVDAGEIRDFARPAPLPEDETDTGASAPSAGDESSGTAEPAPGTPSELPAVEPADPDAYRAAQVAEVEARVSAALAGIERGAATTGVEPTVVVASLADAGRSPELQYLAATGPALVPGGTDLAHGTLTTPSTRQVGYVQSTDLLPGFLERVGIDDLVTPPAQATVVGSPPRVVPGEDTADAGAARIAELVDAQLHAQAMRPVVAPFYLLLVILNVVLYAGVALGLTRPAATRAGAAVARWLRLEGRSVPLAQLRPHVLRALRVVSVAMAAIPVSTFLANLLPWWRVTPPALGLAGATLAIVAVVTAVALARPWRHQILTPLGIVAGLTAAVLVIDIVTGARLQLSAVMGVPVLVAGRFYGFNNTAFALFATACVLLVVAVTNPLVKRGRRWLAASIVAVVGIVAAVVDGAPSIGADFGGPPAILPAFALLALMAAGIRITWARVVLVLGGAALATAAFAVVDYMRPPSERTHLGRFVASTFDGGAWEVVLRKLEANLRILANNRPLTILAIAGVALVVFVLARPLRTAITSPGGGRFAWLSSGAPISQMGTVAPMLRPGLVALAVVLGIGFAVNDSGIAIPAYGVAVAVPLLLAACASWMLTLDGTPVEGDGGADGPGRDPADSDGAAAAGTGPAASTVTTPTGTTDPSDPAATRETGGER